MAAGSTSRWRRALYQSQVVVDDDDDRKYTGTEREAQGTVLICKLGRVTGCKAEEEDEEEDE